MKYINDEALNEVNGGVVGVAGAAGAAGAAGRPYVTQIDLPLFKELAKEAGLADMASVDNLYVLFIASKEAGDLPAKLAGNREDVVLAIRKFLASPAVLALKKL